MGLLVVHDLRMEEMTLDGTNGRSLMLRRDSAPDADRIWRFMATLSVPEGSVTTSVWDLGSGLAEFVRDVADGWKGFDGLKEYATLEGQLLLACRHDGKGTVDCSVTLRQPAPPEWSFEAFIQFGAGAHLEHLADNADAFVPFP
jgi:hypothetical protein